MLHAAGVMGGAVISARCSRAITKRNLAYRMTGGLLVLHCRFAVHFVDLPLGDCVDVLDISLISSLECKAGLFCFVYE